MNSNWINRAIALLDMSLSGVPNELDEIDWKEDLSPDNKSLGKHLSAFANNPSGGFLVFGINNRSGSVVGISREKCDTIISKIGNIARESLEPMVRISHALVEYQGEQLLAIYIKESPVKPVHIKSQSIEITYVRNAGTTRRASRQELSSLLLNSKTPFWEELRASELMVASDVLNSLDYASIFRLLGQPIPKNQNDILTWLDKEKLIDKYEDLGFYITNFGGISAAKKLSNFEELERKAIRIIKYKGTNKQEPEKEFPGNKGYAIRFEELIEFLSNLLPANEQIKKALRTETTLYPEIALRELIANALIHQDFTVRGSGPLIEIFSDRIEITNPGRLLPSKSIDRLIRTNPESRNEFLAKSFRRYKICEERGSGLEKSVAAIEVYQLPPLKFTEMTNSFRVTMYAPKRFKDLTKNERIEAAYQHSILKYFNSSGMTNASLRERFGLSERYRTQISLVIKEALELGRIKPKDPNNQSTKFAEYIPVWG